MVQCGPSVQVRALRFSIGAQADRGYFPRSAWFWRPTGRYQLVATRRISGSHSLRLLLYWLIVGRSVGYAEEHSWWFGTLALCRAVRRPHSQSGFAVTPRRARCLCVLPNQTRQLRLTYRIAASCWTLLLTGLVHDAVRILGDARIQATGTPLWRASHFYSVRPPSCLTAAHGLIGQ